MTNKLKVPCNNPTQAHTELVGTVWPFIKANLMAGRRMTLTVLEETRSEAQNNLMWSCLRDLSKQVVWFGKKLTDEGWKHFITGHLDGQDVVPNMDGTGFISLTKGKSTSQMSRAEMTAVIDMAHAFGTEQGVKWSPASLGRWANETERQSTGEVIT